jgi:hypothetical protein
LTYSCDTLDKKLAVPTVYEEHYDLEEPCNVMKDIKSQPCISVIIPFEPQMESKSAIENRLKSTMNKVSTQLLKQYPDEKALHVYEKLNSLIKNLNYHTHKKSIVAFVSPFIEKIYYLDSPMKEKVIIDEFLEISDTIYSKREIGKYHLKTDVVA